jgi:Spy/CpxP family protein refolding chaperone
MFDESNSMEPMMKRINLKLFTIATAFVVAFSFSMPAHAQDAASLFKSDGTGSAMGKKMGAHDFTSADVQGMTDAQLTETITNGKGKMPKYSSLTPEQVKGLVAYIRTLKK